MEWRALLFGRVVADFQIDKPKLYLNRVQLKKELDDKVPLKERGWQAALEAIYPLKIDHFAINGGELTYVDEGPFRPLHITDLNLRAENIRNIRSPEHVYPSKIHLDGVVFGTGTLTLDGNADFLAQPHATFKTAVAFVHVELDYFRPIIARYNLTVRKGTLSATGQMEYAADKKIIVIPKMTLAGVDADYIHRSPAPVTTKAAQTVDRTVKEYSDQSTLQARIDRLDIVKSRLAIVNRSVAPGYTVFFSDMNVNMTNFSNQSGDGLARGKLQGKFMGSGASTATLAFRPGARGPDFTLNVAIENTDMRALNDLFRAYGNFDVTGGLFSFYCEAVVRDATLNGYIKPLFRDVTVYDRRQDQQKSFFHKVYEGIIGGLSWVLQNTPRSEVATRIALTGTLSNPQTSTLETIFGFVQNAFFKAILPGFEREIPQQAKKIGKSDGRQPSLGPDEQRSGKDVIYGKASQFNSAAPATVE